MHVHLHTAAHLAIGLLLTCTAGGVMAADALSQPVGAALETGFAWSDLVPVILASLGIAGLIAIRRQSSLL
jgi:hypothetical protein